MTTRWTEHPDWHDREHGFDHECGEPVPDLITAGNPVSPEAFAELQRHWSEQMRMAAGSHLIILSEPSSWIMPQQVCPPLPPELTHGSGCGMVYGTDDASGTRHSRPRGESPWVPPSGRGMIYGHENRVSYRAAPLARTAQYPPVPAVTQTPEQLLAQEIRAPRDAPWVPDYPAGSCAGCHLSVPLVPGTGVCVYCDLLARTRLPDPRPGRKKHPDDHYLAGSRETRRLTSSRLVAVLPCSRCGGRGTCHRRHDRARYAAALASAGIVVYVVVLVFLLATGW